MTKIKFDNEKQRYTVQSRNERFVIMTKQFNAQKAYIYTIADMDRLERGPCNLIFGIPFDVNTPEGAQEALNMIEAGEMEVSHRKSVALSDAEIAQLRA